MSRNHFFYFNIFILLIYVTSALCEETAQIHQFDSSNYLVVNDAIELNLSIVGGDKKGLAEPIWLCIIAENVSDATMYIDWSDYEYERFTFHGVRKGKDVPYTEYGRKIVDKPADSLIVSMGRSLNFTPGMKIKCQYLINRVYDMSLKGEYVFSATCSYIDHNGKKICNAKSNSVTADISEIYSSYLPSLKIEHPGDSIPPAPNNDLASQEILDATDPKQP
jgi:hypothetical protein